jgi:Amt family ammonium transporter
MVVCCFSNVNEWLHIDDGLEVFKLHGIGGIVGGFLTGIFATSRISSLDGATIASGAIDGNGIQVAKQIAEICAVSAYSFTASVVMLTILKYIPGMHLRVPDEIEAIGYDMDQFHEGPSGSGHCGSRTSTASSRVSSRASLHLSRLITPSVRRPSRIS